MKKNFDPAAAAVRLRGFCRERGRPPSYGEIATLFRYKSKNAAFWLVRRMEERGFLKKDTKGKVIFKASASVRVLGTVTAGFPSPAEEELADTMSLDEYLIKNPEQTFLIKVVGDSMIDAGIREGDLVLVERGRTPKNRDIVIAQVDREWTMKYYEKTGTDILLVPANKKYPPIKPRQELVIGGVIVAVIRKYR